MVGTGPNGSGKSTFISQMEAGAFELEIALPQVVLNPDEFARRTDPLHPDRVAPEAGRAVLTQRAELLSARLDFAIETTLSGHGEVRLLSDGNSGSDFREIIFFHGGRIVRCESALPGWAERALALQLETYRHRAENSP